MLLVFILKSVMSMTACFIVSEIIILLYFQSLMPLMMICFLVDIIMLPDLCEAINLWLSLSFSILLMITFKFVLPSSF